MRGLKSIISSFIISGNRKGDSAREKLQFIDQMRRESVTAVSQATKSKLKKSSFLFQSLFQKELKKMVEIHAQSLGCPTKMFFSNCLLKRWSGFDYHTGIKTRGPVDQQ